ncbi:pitrilysin family protein [Paraferrimonas sp. SM1919]|uniref:M16 family metallopeptidase n=1 Tax=Paraferrimonas sp. SM1919 TaxID=2662263 RepID=UPI0013D5EFBF|nr:pitrilysin family protein [Paraferrimonas sp. SM1919]
MKKNLISLSLVSLLIACQPNTHSTLPQSVTLVEQVEQTPERLAIPYKKYRLDNGLTVILAPDHSDPLVHLDVTYHVGSAREEIGRSGFAHLFEHMMFQGSKNVADEQHFKIVTESGGSMNGTTNTDRTNYYQTVPKNQLEKVLWLEADRMGYLLPAITEKKFENQRETVKNERGQRIDNVPYGRVGERVAQALYPVGHPYSWPIIGWMDDLNAATVDDVRAFFNRWYGPNNATLTLGGDFDEAQALALIDKYFAPISRGPEVKDLEVPLVTLDADRYISMEDKVHLPLLYMSMPTVKVRHQDEAPLDLLAQILGGGDTSILYKNLVKNGYAVQVGAQQPCSELSCTFSIYALANPAKAKGLATIEDIIRDSIKEFENRGVNDDDLTKVKVGYKANTIFSLQSVAGKVSTLALNETLFGNPDLIQSDLDRYANVTKEQVMAVFNQYVKDKPMVIMSVVPQGQQALIAKADNFTPTAAPVVELSKSDGTERQHKADSFDRSKVPPAAANPTFELPVLHQAKLANTLQVLSTQSSETPTTDITIHFDGGNLLVDKSKAGLANLTAAMLQESSQLRSTEELATALELLGASVSFSGSRAGSTLTISALTEYLDETIAIAIERLIQPAFNEADFAKVKGQLVQSLAQQSQTPDWMARTAFDGLIYPQSALGQPSSGSAESVSQLSLADVKNFYNVQYQVAKAQLVAVSSLSSADLMAKLKAFEVLSGDNGFTAPNTHIQASQAGVIYLVDKPASAQSVIRIGRQAMPYDATGEYFKAYLMNYPLGGAFNSRINLNLREDKGYTYGAGSGFNGGKLTGVFVATANVRSDVTAASLKEFENEIRGFALNGMTVEELNFLKASIGQSSALKFETPSKKSGFIRQIQMHNLPHDYLLSQNQLIEQITLQELNSVAKQQLNFDDMVIVIVGDAVTVKPELEKLGYQVKLHEL